MLEYVRRSNFSHGLFDYCAAFSRNIGWVTECEQQQLRTKTIAIAGLGGVGCAHALTLCRLGIGGFHLADLDHFDLANFNRQSGAFLSTIGFEKTAVTARMIQDINPELRLKTFERGVEDGNLDEFLSGADLFVDGLDFFALSIRRKVFKRCSELGIPAITAAPIGFGSSYLIFKPGGMTFEEYFRLEGRSDEQQYVNFALGLTPKGLHRSYLVDLSRLDLAHHRGPSTAAAVQLCAGVVAAEAVKILLGRGKVYAAPFYHQFDAYRGCWKRGQLRSGNFGPLQTLKRHIGYRTFAHLSQKSRPAESAAPESVVERILDLARWAPSGDNAQPWRFEVGTDWVTIRSTPKADIYDYRGGEPSLLATGMLLENLRIAATRFGHSMDWHYSGLDGDAHVIRVTLLKDERLTEDTLAPYIALRSVDRRPYRRGRLSEEQKQTLELALSPRLRIVWHESASARSRQAWLNAISTDVRLRIAEAYAVHRDVIKWDEAFSREGIPAGAIGSDPLTARLMRWVMGSWARQHFFNRFLLGTLVPRIQLDLLPGMYSAAHFTILRDPGASVGDQVQSLLADGMHIQRLWLTATQLGLVIQPTLSPMIFAHYGKAGPNSLSDRVASRKAQWLAKQLETEGFGNTDAQIFRGRIGIPGRRATRSRSIRHSLADLTRTSEL